MWDKVRLGEVLRLDNNFEEVNPVKDYLFAGVYSFGNGLFERGIIKGNSTTYKQFNKLKKDHLVISKVKGWEGAIAIVDQEYEEYYLSSVYPMFKAIEGKLDINFLNYFCKQSKVWKNLLDNSRGIGARRNSVSEEQFLNLEIPLPPIEEQKRIVEKLDAVKIRIDEAMRLRAEAIREAERLKDGIIEEIFNTIINKFGTKKVIELSTLVTKGSSPRWQGIRYVDIGILFITSENVKTNSLNLDNPKYLEESFNTLQKRSILKKHDVLMNIVGASIGRTALFEIDVTANINQAVCLIRFNKELIHPKFAVHFFNSRICLKYMFDNMVDSARPNLSMTNIKNIDIPVPPLEKQKVVIEEIENIEKKLLQINSVTNGTSNDLESLFPNVLEKAFRGKL